MPRTRSKKIHANKLVKQCTPMKLSSKRVDKDAVGMDAPQNKNSNHASIEAKQRIGIEEYRKRNKSASSKINKMKDEGNNLSDTQNDVEVTDEGESSAPRSNVTSQTVEFEEDSELIQMEIDDGGAAVNEYASKNEGSESEDSCTAESGNETEGEITEQSDGSERSDSEEETTEVEVTSVQKRKRKSRGDPE